MSIFSFTIVNMSIETPDGVLDVTNATLRVPQIEVQGTSVTTSLSTLSNVGVGTTTPGGRLHVYGPDAKTLLQSTSNTANVEIGGPSGAIVDLKGPFTDDYDLRIQSSSDGGNLATTGNVNHIRLASTSGYTGFGTATPQYKIDAQGVKGIDAVSNPSAHNPVFLYDDQESTTTFSGTVGGTGASRNTTSKYIELNSLADNVTGYAYWPIQMPNSWSAEFDHFIGGGDGGESLSFSFFNTSAPTTTGNHGGYRLAIAEFYGGAPAAKAVLYYQGSEVAQKNIVGGIPSSSWNKVVVNYNRGSISLSLNGRSVFSYEATENADSYTGRYVGFIGKTGLRDNFHRVRNVKCTSGTNWVYATGSNATTLAYLSGNVGIGTDVTTERLEISGNVKATHFVGDGGLLSNIATTLNAIVNQGNTTSNTVQFTNADTGIVSTGNIVVEEGGFFVGDGSKLVNIPTDFESIIVNGNTTSNVVYFANTDVAIQASGNVVVDSDSFFIGNGGLLSNIATTLEDISNQGNATSNTIQFTNSDVGFVTTANVGISNSAPTKNLSVGSNLHVDDTGSNVLTVHGNVAANAVTIGAFQVVASYGLNQVTAENNQTSDTLVLTNATKGIDASSNIDLGGQLNFGSNVKIVGGGSGTYLSTLRVANVASNIVTYDQATGEVFDSGGLISNKLAIVSEQPPSALTGGTTTVTGHGKYVLTSSLQASGYDVWKCFDKDVNTGWSTGAVGAYNSDGTYAGSNVIAGVNGEWVKIEFPYKTTLRHISLVPLTWITAMPEDFSIVASNDDSTWVVLKSVDGQVWSSTTQYVNFIVNASTAYKYYAIVVELTNNNFAQIGEWKLFTETFTVDAGKVNMTGASGLETGFTEHPVQALTGSSTHNANIGSIGEFPPSTHYVEGHGTYEVWASTQYNASGQPRRTAWNLFDKLTTTVYQHSSRTNYDNYNSSSPYEYTGTRNTTTGDVGGTRYKGVWVQIKTPYPITLSHSNVLASTDLLERAPATGVILGSNDGEHWYKLTEFTGKTYSNGVWTRIDVNATTPYQYFRMVVTNVVASASLQFAEWRLFAEKDVTKFENVHISGDLSSETLQTGYIKWPRKSLKANESEGYVASASNVYNTTVTAAPFAAFNQHRETGNNGYSDAFVGGNGDFTSGVANKSRTTGDDTFNHEWLQIQLPQAIQLSHFTLLQRLKNIDNDTDMPKNGRMYGSNDGISWTKLITFSDLTYERFEETRVDVKSSEAYKYYRLAITDTIGSSQVFVAIGELQLFEAATGVGGAPTSAKLQVHGSLGLAKGSSLYAGDSVVAEFPRHDRPLTKYPEVAMTADSSGGYVASGSSQYYDGNFSYFKAFDHNSSTHWVSSGTSKFDSNGDPTATSNIFPGTSYRGEYCAIKLPKPIKLHNFDISPRNSSSVYSNPPKDLRVFGSKDGKTWTHIKQFQNLSFTGFNKLHLHVNDSNTYNEYAFFVEKITVSSGGAQYCTIAELEYWGTEEGDESVDIVHRSIPNTPGQQQLAVYYEARDPNSYSFADSTKVYDLSGNGRTGTLTGGVGYDAVDNAFTFDGVNDYIESTLPSTFVDDQVHTFSVWFKRTSSVDDDVLFSIAPTAGETSNKVIQMRLNDNNDDDYSLSYIFWNNDLRYSPELVDGMWYHLCGTYSGNGGTSDNKLLYLNGTLIQATQTYGTPSDLLDIDASSTLRVGSRVNHSSMYYFDGSIANYRLYSKALNADQVRELYEYDAERFGHRQNLVALHKGNLGVGVAHPTSRFEVAGADGLQEFPPKAMTGYETYIEGHGVFRVSASSEYSTNYTSWRAFNKLGYSGVDGWSSGQYTVLEASGLPDTANCAVFDGIYCNWLELEIPYQIKLKRVLLELRNTGNAPEEMPKDGFIYASKDGANWTLINAFNNLNYGGSTGTLRPTIDIDTSNSYRIFRLVITANYLPGTAYTDVGELRLFGTPAPSGLEDGHLTLGKALTAPRFTGHAAGAETPRAESLVVHYDTTVDSVVAGSTVVDISGQGNNGTLNGNATYSSSDRALTFDGTGDTVTATFPSSSGDNTFSVSFWMKRAANAATYCPVYIGDAANGEGIGMDIYTNGSVYWFIYGGKNFLWTGVTGAWFPVGSWTHVVASHTAGTDFANINKVWINGVDVTSQGTFGGAEDLTLNTYDTITLGARVNLNYLNGSISNFKLYNVALTAEEVAAEYALGRTGKSLNVTDTAVCLGGTVPRAQLDVRGSARFETTQIDYVGVGVEPAPLNHALFVSGNGRPIKLRDMWGNNANPVLILDRPSSFDFASPSPSSWRLLDITTSSTRQCGINLLNYSTAGSGQYNIDGRRKTGLGFSVSSSDGINVTENALSIAAGGNVGIGNTNPTSPLTIQHTDNSTRTSGMQFKDYGSNDYWSTWINNLNHFYFAYNNVDKGYILSGGSVAQMNFTGQHRTFIKDIPFTRAEELEGLIVSADNNKYIKMSGSIEMGSNAITTNESLPVVSLSTKANDKKCFGVISASEDPEERSDAYGSFVTPYEKELGDTRVYINSVGEGAMWVVNTAGPLESGDYITTSNVAGYGQRQESDSLKNYTVAKITMDCDFMPATQPIQIIKKELANVNYWVKTTYSNVSLEEYSNLAEENRTTEDETYYTKDVERKFTYKPTVTVTADDAWDDVSIFPSGVTYAEWSNLEANVQNTYTLTYTQNDYESMRYEKTTVSNVTAEDAWDAVHIEPPTVTYAEYSNLEANVQNTYSLTFTKSMTITTTPAYYSNLAPEEQNTYTLVYTKTVTENVEAGTEGADAHVRTIYKKIEREDTKEERDDEEWVLDVRQELENVLDEHGQLQWEDDPSGATEKAYKIRYLDASGQITDEANAVHTAAFVGVTYHCG
jgi:hypothetical protein